MRLSIVADKLGDLLPQPLYLLSENSIIASPSVISDNLNGCTSLTCSKSLSDT